jgi:diaminohydroxyphosphoribosylaminopyrimidine deaminase/5-amino-6-(5-phosphoribosylamino)uracil reductase
VTLEPCAHFGRTPPCADAVLEARVARVVVGMKDPNPLVCGRGLKRLRQAGVSVSSGVLGTECRRLLSGYLTYVTMRRPLVVLKLAASLDGRIATATGASRWITGAQARRRSHEMRDRLDAVMVGAGTVRADDPRLTCRIPGGRDPIRIVLDGRLSISPRSRVLRVGSQAPTWIFAAQDASERRAATLARGGAEVIRLRGRGTVHLPSVLRELWLRGVTSVLVEGGATLAAAALRARLVDRVVLFLAPMIIGGDGVPAVAALGTKRVAGAVQLRNVKFDRIGDDLVIEASLPLSPRAL